MPAMRVHGRLLQGPIAQRNVTFVMLEHGHRYGVVRVIHAMPAHGQHWWRALQATDASTVPLEVGHPLHHRTLNDFAFFVQLEPGPL